MSKLFPEKKFDVSFASKMFAMIAIGTTLLVARAKGRDIAFFYALDADFKSFALKAQPIGKPIKLGSRNVQRLKIGAENIYAVKMGSGTVETAISAATLLTKFPCDLAFSVGPVGTLDDAIPIASWHEVNSVIAHQKGAWTRNGFQIGRTSENEGRVDATAPSSAHLGHFQTPALFDHIDTITVASGELFIASTAYRQQLRTTTGAQTVDMNLLGLESVCQDFRIPLFSWRVVSDRADDDAPEKFKSFVATYRGEGGSAIADIICKLPPDQNSLELYPELGRLLNAPRQDTQ